MSQWYTKPPTRRNSFFQVDFNYDSISLLGSGYEDETHAPTSVRVTRRTPSLPLGFPPFIMQGFTTVPFKTESEHGLTKVDGIAKFSSAGVVLEFESKLFGLIGGGVKEVRLPLADILDVKFRKGYFVTVRRSSSG